MRAPKHIINTIHTLCAMCIYWIYPLLKEFNRGFTQQRVCKSLRTLVNLHGKSESSEELDADRSGKLCGAGDDQPNKKRAV